MLDDKKKNLIEQFANNYVSEDNYSDALYQLSQLYRTPRDFEWNWRKFLAQNTENVDNAKTFLKDLQDNIIDILRSPHVPGQPIRLHCIPEQHSLKNLTSLLRRLGFSKDGRWNVFGNPEVMLQKLRTIFSELFIFISIFSETYLEIGDPEDSESEEEKEEEENDDSLDHMPDPDAKCYVCDHEADVFCTDCKPNSTTFLYFCDEDDRGYHEGSNFASHVRRRIVKQQPKKKCHKCGEVSDYGSFHKCARKKSNERPMWAEPRRQSGVGVGVSTDPDAFWICSECYASNRSNFVFCQACTADRIPHTRSSFEITSTPIPCSSNTDMLLSKLNKNGSIYSYKTVVCVSRQLSENANKPVSDEEIDTWLNGFINAMVEWGDPPIFWRVEDVVTYIEGRDSERLSCDRDRLANLAMQHILSRKDALLSIAQHHSEQQVMESIEEHGLNKAAILDQLNHSTCRDLPLAAEARLTLDALVDAIVRISQNNLDAARILAMSEFALPTPNVATLCIKLLQVDELREILGTCRLTYENFFRVIKRTRNLEDCKRQLLQECELCYCSCSKESMCSFMTCGCEICSDCFTRFFDHAVRNDPPTSWACPLCFTPNMQNVYVQGNETLIKEKEKELEIHFMNLNLIIHNRFHLRDLRNLFTTKLTAWRLSKDEKFLWCAHGCGNGMIYLGAQKSVVCNSCNGSTCKDCKNIWEPEHEGRTCEEFEAWKILQDPHIAKLMQLSGIVCPNCHMRYQLVRGGCLHFTCHQCKYEFCGGCNEPIYTKDGCPNGCKGLGLHAHHPRDCLFFLRDWSVADLEKLLSNNNVALNAAIEGLKKCPVKITDSLEGDEQECGKDCLKADLCEKHYIEYLVNLINRNKLDPATLMDIQALSLWLAKAKAPPLVKGPQENAEAFRQRVIAQLQTSSPIVGLT